MPRATVKLKARRDVAGLRDSRDAAESIDALTRWLAKRGWTLVYLMDEFQEVRDDSPELPLDDPETQQERIVVETNLHDQSGLEGSGAGSARVPDDQPLDIPAGLRRARGAA